MAVDYRRYRNIEQVTGRELYVRAIQTSTGAGDANKIFATDATGKIDSSFLPAISASLTSTYVGFGNASNILTGSSSFTYDSTTHALTFTPNPGVAIPGAINLQAVAGSGANVQGGNVAIQAGTGGTNGAGGTSTFKGGNASGTGTAGAASITGGNTTGSGSGGNIALNGGTSGTGPGGPINLTGGNGGVGAGGSGGNIALAGGVGNSSAPGGTVSLTGGATTSGLGGDIIISGGAAPSGTRGNIKLSAGATELFRILPNGALSIGASGTNYGTSGQVLISQGNAAPIWSNATASLTSTQVGYGNASNILTGSSTFTYNPTTGALTFNPGTVASPAFSLLKAASSTTAPASITLRGGDTSSGSDQGGETALVGGTGGIGGTVSLLGGSGSSHPSGNGGRITLTGGPGNGGGNGGEVTISGGSTPSGLAGHINFNTTNIERLRILANGAWSIGPSGNNYGTSGQVLISQGNGAAPVWGTANYVQLSGGTLTGSLTLAADPTLPLHAATKQYVDNLFAGLDPKANVRVATTANIDLSSAPASIDGVTLSSGNRVLVKDQTTASQNGIYVFNGAASAMTRSTDTDGTPSNEVTTGMYCFAIEGTANAESGWILTTSDPITVGTTALTFAQFNLGGGVPGGTSGTIQYNNAGSFAGITGLTSDGTNVTFSSGTLTLAAAPTADLHAATKKYVDDTVAALAADTYTKDETLALIIALG